MPDEPKLLGSIALETSGIVAAGNRVNSTLLKMNQQMVSLQQQAIKTGTICFWPLSEGITASSTFPRSFMSFIYL